MTKDKCKHGVAPPVDRRCPACFAESEWDRTSDADWEVVSVGSVFGVKRRGAETTFAFAPHKDIAERMCVLLREKK